MSMLSNDLYTYYFKTVLSIPRLKEWAFRTLYVIQLMSKQIFTKSETLPSYLQNQKHGHLLYQIDIKQIIIKREA